MQDPRWVDVRSDIFSLGVTLFDMLTGGLSSRSRRDEKPSPLKAGRPSLELLDGLVEDDLIEIVAQMTQMEPIRRYQDPEELTVALTKALTNAPAPETTAGVQWIVNEAMYREATGHLWLERGATIEEESEKETTEIQTTVLPNP